MFLGIDVGNTSTMIALYEDDSVVPINEGIFRYKTDKRGSDDILYHSLAMALKNYSSMDVIEAEITGIAFSSVVPEINKSYHRVCKRIFSIEPLEISHKSNFSIKLHYGDPSKLGVDRIVNTEAAFHEYGNGSIIVDIGTAATFDVLDFEGNFVGGLIAPGIGTTIKALADAASNLPEIVFEKPEKMIATDTVNAIKSGFYYGWISMIEGICARIEEEYRAKFRLIITGGFASKMKDSFSRDVIIDPLLTMKGIKYIFDNNRGKS